MPKQLLVRNIPKEVGEWIEIERKGYNMTQQEFVLSVLNKGYSEGHEEQLPLFPLKRLLSKPNGKSQFTFVDLFAGIGGFRIALEKLGGECVFTSEWDKYAQKTYKAWFGEMPQGDIRKINPSIIPDHHILAAGFPCQPFSIAGVSKKKSLGRAHGFKDKNQGNLFFFLATIIEAKKPPVLFLENVKNLKSHDKGKTWQVIRKTLEDLGYNIFERVYDAAHWVPQHRERIFIIGFDKKVYGENMDFVFPEPPERSNSLKSILEKNPSEKYTLTTNLWNYLQQYAKRHQEKGNGFGFGIADPEGITRTLSARYYKDGSEILIKQKNGKAPRRLTPTECARLMGFPPECKIVVSDTQAYRQFGNAVVVPAVTAVAKVVVQDMVIKKLARSNNKELLLKHVLV